MSTRCNIVLRFGKSVVYIYRHCDGYPAEVGGHLVEVIRASVAHPSGGWYSAAGVAGKVLAALLGARYEKASYEDAPRAIYELTSDYHGDIEHAYEVKVPDSWASGPAKVKVRHAARPSHFPPVDEWCRGGSFVSVDDFAKVVNRERVASNRRLAELAKESKIYRDAEPYPMIEEAA